MFAFDRKSNSACDCSLDSFFVLLPVKPLFHVSKEKMIFRVILGIGNILDGVLLLEERRRKLG